MTIGRLGAADRSRDLCQSRLGVQNACVSRHFEGARARAHAGESTAHGRGCAPGWPAHRGNVALTECGRQATAGAPFQLLVGVVVKVSPGPVLLREGGSEGRLISSDCWALSSVIGRIAEWPIESLELEWARCAAMFFSNSGIARVSDLGRSGGMALP